MHAPLRLLPIAGSLRRESFNRKLLKTLKARLAASLGSGRKRRQQRLPGFAITTQARLPPRLWFSQQLPSRVREFGAGDVVGREVLAVDVRAEAQVDRFEAVLHHRRAVKRTFRGEQVAAFPQ